MIDEEGVTNVLGAILVVALAVTFMVKIETEYQPQWDQDRESAHLDALLSQFADLKAQGEKQTENRTLSPVSNPLRMGPAQPIGLFSKPQPEGMLRFESASQNTSFAAAEIRLIERDGLSLGTLNEQWHTAAFSNSLDEVSRLDSLRIRLTGQNAAKLELKADAFVNLDVTDANGDHAGSFRAYVPPKDKHDIWARITTATGEVLVNQELASDVRYKEHNQFWIDTLDPSWPFRQVLNAAARPFTLELTWGFPDISDPAKWPRVDYAASYVSRTEAGQDLFIGGGSSGAVNFVQAEEGGRLRYDIAYQHTPPVALVVEHGAVILAQPDGNSMVLEPILNARRSGAITVVDIVAPTYIGDSATHGGTAAMTVITRAIGTASLLGTTAQFTLTLDSAYPEVWAQFLRERLGGSGLEEGPEFSIATSAQTVQLTLFGTSSSSSTHDIQIRLDQPRLRVDLA